jgi:type II secretory pathway pseudopilin PulG
MIMIIAVLGLLLFFRWWRRRQRQEEREYNTMLEERNLIAMQRRKLKPLPVSIVNSYPIQEYNSDTIKNTTCAICLDEFEENQPDIRLLPCGHGFCVLCIGKSFGKGGV